MVGTYDTARREGWKDSREETNWGRDTCRQEVKWVVGLDSVASK